MTTHKWNSSDNLPKSNILIVVEVDADKFIKSEEYRYCNASIFTDTHFFVAKHSKDTDYTIYGINDWYNLDAKYIKRWKYFL